MQEVRRNEKKRIRKGERGKRNVERKKRIEKQKERTKWELEIRKKKGR